MDNGSIVTASGSHDPQKRSIWGAALDRVQPLRCLESLTNDHFNIKTDATWQAISFETESRQSGADACPENCRWLSRFEQASNKRNNRHITLDGVTKTITQWARESGIPATTIKARLDRYHWTERDAVTIPVGVPKNPRSKGEKHVV